MNRANNRVGTGAPASHGRARSSSDDRRCRHELAHLNDELAKRAQQFRVIEKRLLVRLKDRNPAPLQNLE